MSEQQQSGARDTFISHLIELRNRLVKSSVAVLVVFGILFVVWPGPAAIYDFLARPMMESLPAGAKMIATGVITPFLVPM
jgi:sec-independent protein translocase protein TatC